MTHFFHLTLSENGHLDLPEGAREALGVQKGGKLIAHVDNGTLILESVATAVRRAQAIVRQYVPEGVSLADELIAERRAASEQE